MHMVSWCVVVVCLVGVVVAAPGHGLVESSVNIGVDHPQPATVQHTHQTHHTVDPHFRESQFYKAMDEAGANLFRGLGNAGNALGEFLARLAGGGRAALPPQ